MLVTCACKWMHMQQPAEPLTFFSSPCRELRWVSRLSALSALPPWNLTGDIPYTMKHIHITLSLIVGCNHGREKVWSYRHQGYKKGPQDVLFSATTSPSHLNVGYHLSTYMYCHNMQPLILAYILHNNQRLEVMKRLPGKGGGVYAHMHPST